MKPFYALRAGLLTLVLGASLLSGCLSRMADDEASERQIETLTRQLVRSMMQAEPEGLGKLISLPFWNGSWQDELDELGPENLAGPAPVPVRPDEVEVRLRYYPLGDLEVLRPEVWQKLKASAPEHLQGLQVAVAGLSFKANGRTDSLIMLLRRVDGEWRVAGVLEAR